MNTFCIAPSSNKEITPSWITSERYYNCGSFESDLKSGNTSILTMIRNLFMK